MKKKYLISLTLVILVTLIIIWSGYSTVLNTKASKSTVTKTHTQIQQFQAITLDGNEFVSPEKGIVVYEVFAQWCFPCRTSVPQALAFSRANPNVDVIGIAFRDIDTRIKEFENEYGSFKTTIMSTPKLETALGMTSAPQTLFIKDNVIVYRSYGIATKEELNRILLLVK